VKLSDDEDKDDEELLLLNGLLDESLNANPRRGADDKPSVTPFPVAQFYVGLYYGLVSF